MMQLGHPGQVEAFQGIQGIQGISHLFRASQGPEEGFGHSYSALSPLIVPPAPTVRARPGPHLAVGLAC